MKNDKILDTMTNSELAVFRLRHLYRGFGYSRYKMSKFEEYDLYVRNKDFLPSESVITFTDGAGRLLALKPDVTLSIIKSCPDTGVGVTKLCYNESVYRPQNQQGSFKEITQVGIECLGAVTDGEVAEVITLAAKSLGEFSESYALEISSLDITSAALDTLALSQLSRKRMLECIGAKSKSGIIEVARAEGVSDEDAHILLMLTDIYGTPGAVKDALSSLAETEALKCAVLRFTDLLDELERGGVGEHLFVDFSSLGNMKYYNGIAFKGYINGIPRCVLSGGQYDNLLSRMRKNMRGVGFAFYLDELDRLPE